MNSGFRKIEGRLAEYLRILRLARKPTSEEFKMVARVSFAGIVAIGLIGFFIYFLMVQLPKMF